MMNYFNYNKKLVWALLILLVLNVSVIGTIVYHVYFDKQETAFDAEPSTEAPIFLKERMDLNESQWNDFRRLHSEFRRDSREIFAELHQLRKEILEEVSHEEPDKVKLYELAERYGEKHSLLKKKTIDHFLGMKENISPEQERMMNAFLRNMMEHEGMGRGPGQGKRHRFRR